MIHEDLRQLEALYQLLENLLQFDRLNHYEGANLDDPRLKAAIGSAKRKISSVERRLRPGLKELTKHPIFSLNGARLSKTAVKALIGSRGYEQVLSEARETFLDTPLMDNTFSTKYGNLAVGFYERDSEEEGE